MAGSGYEVGLFLCEMHFRKYFNTITLLMKTTPFFIAKYILPISTAFAKTFFEQVENVSFWKNVVHFYTEEAEKILLYIPLNYFAISLTCFQTINYSDTTQYLLYRKNDTIWSKPRKQTNTSLLFSSTKVNKFFIQQLYIALLQQYSGYQCLDVTLLCTKKIDNVISFHLQVYILECGTSQITQYLQQKMALFSSQLTLLLHQIKQEVRAFLVI